jgi:hypothetical protein
MNTMHATCTSRGVHIALRYENLWWYELFTNKESRVYSGATALKLAYLCSQFRYRREELKAILWLRMFFWCHASSRSRTAVELSLFGPHLFDTLVPISSCHFPTPTHSHTHPHFPRNSFFCSKSTNERFVFFISSTKTTSKVLFPFLVHYCYCIWLKAETPWPQAQAQTISVYFSNINITS